MRTTTGLVAAMTLLVSAAIAQDMAAFRTVAESDLGTVFKQKSTLVVDARMPDERGKWGLACTNCSTSTCHSTSAPTTRRRRPASRRLPTPPPRARRLPRRRLPARRSLVVCLAGGRSGAAAEHLAKMGVKAVLLADGLGGLKDAKNIKGSKPKG